MENTMVENEKKRSSMSSNFKGIKFTIIEETSNWNVLVDASLRRELASVRIAWVIWRSIVSSVVLSVSGVGRLRLARHGLQGLPVFLSDFAMTVQRVRQQQWDEGCCRARRVEVARAFSSHGCSWGRVCFQWWLRSMVGDNSNCEDVFWRSRDCFPMFLIVRANCPAFGADIVDSISSSWCWTKATTY